VSYELLSCCLLAGPLWGSSWAKIDRFYVMLTSLCFFGRIGLRGRKLMRASGNQIAAGHPAGRERQHAALDIRPGSNSISTANRHNVATG
jgi:hypothetical protein